MYDLKPSKRPVQFLCRMMRLSCKMSGQDFIHLRPTSTHRKMCFAGLSITQGRGGESTVSPVMRLPGKLGRNCLPQVSGSGECNHFYLKGRVKTFLQFVNALLLLHIALCDQVSANHTNLEVNNIFYEVTPLSATSIIMLL